MRPSLSDQRGLVHPGLKSLLNVVLDAADDEGRGDAGHDDEEHDDEGRVELLEGGLPAKDQGEEVLWHSQADAELAVVVVTHGQIVQGYHWERQIT